MCLHGRNLFRAVHCLTDDFCIGQEVAFPKPPAAVLVQSTARICQHDDGGKGLIDNRDFLLHSGILLYSLTAELALRTVKDHDHRRTGPANTCGSMLAVFGVRREQTVHELNALRQKLYTDTGFQVDVLLKPLRIRRNRQQHNYRSPLLLCLEAPLLYPAAKICSTARRAAEHRMLFLSSYLYYLQFAHFRNRIFEKMRWFCDFLESEMCHLPVFAAVSSLTDHVMSPPRLYRLSVAVKEASSLPTRYTV